MRIECTITLENGETGNDAVVWARMSGLHHEKIGSSLIQVQGRISEEAFSELARKIQDASN
jgi:hypothetical protein